MSCCDFYQCGGVVSTMYIGIQMDDGSAIRLLLNKIINCPGEKGNGRADK